MDITAEDRQRIVDALRAQAQLHQAGAQHLRLNLEDKGAEAIRHFSAESYELERLASRVARAYIPGGNGRVPLTTAAPPQPEGNARAPIPPEPIERDARRFAAAFEELVRQAEQPGADPSAEEDRAAMLEVIDSYAQLRLTLGLAPDALAGAKRRELTPKACAESSGGAGRVDGNTPPSAHQAGEGGSPSAT